VSEHDDGLSRRDAVGGFLVGAGALSFPSFLEPGEALAASAAARDREMALFLGQDQLPVPPENAKVRTSACQYCNVGCGYKIYTWPVGRTPRRAGRPEGPLSDWISPAMVTRGKVDGKDS
jgi:hypothetical protein